MEMLQQNQQQGLPLLLLIPLILVLLLSPLLPFLFICIGSVKENERKNSSELLE